MEDRKINLRAQLTLKKKSKNPRWKSRKKCKASKNVKNPEFRRKKNQISFRNRLVFCNFTYTVSILWPSVETRNMSWSWVEGGIKEEEIGINRRHTNESSFNCPAEFLKVTVSPLCDGAKFSWLCTKVRDLYVQAWKFMILFIF